MKIAMSHAPVTNGRDVIMSLRSKAEKLAERSLPAAASAAERAGERASQLARSSSHSLAKTLRRNSPTPASALAAFPLLRGAGRIVRRHPIFVATGLTAAAIGYLAWRHRSDEQEDLSTEDQVD